MATGKFAGTVAAEQQNRAFKTNSFPCRLAGPVLAAPNSVNLSVRKRPATRQDRGTHHAARLTI
jgi:hypothetical protein